MTDRLGDLDDLPESLRGMLKLSAPKNTVIETLKHLDGMATMDEILVFQYRIFKVTPKSRRQFQSLLQRMGSRQMIERKGRGVWAISNAVRRKASAAPN